MGTAGQSYGRIVEGDVITTALTNGSIGALVSELIVEYGVATLATALCVVERDIRISNRVLLEDLV